MDYIFQTNKSNIKLGDLLIDNLEKRNGTLIIVSAFAKCSGVLRLKSKLIEYRNRGNKIISYIGCDAGGTSYEALTNIFMLSNETTVIHDNNTGITFHPKMYISYDNDSAWVYVGSSNFTSGGFWTNTEFGNIKTFNLNEQSDRQCFDEILLQIKNICEKSNSFKILSQSNIDTLRDNNLLPYEAETRVKRRKGESKDKDGKNDTNPFPTGTLNQPKINDNTNSDSNSDDENNEEKSDIKQLDQEINDEFVRDTIWFQYGRGTGGSRNILDLSKVGQLISGDSNNTVFYIDKTYVKGGVTFFDVDPSNTAQMKDITLNYLGKDYYNNTILYPTGDNANGTWRLQLKGVTQNNERLSLLAIDNFVNKILLFTKIETDYYLLSTIESDQLSELEISSKFVASNGRLSVNSRKFGLL